MTIYIIEKLIVKVRKKMLKSLKISLIAIDKTNNLVYNTSMKNNNNNTLTKKGTNNNMTYVLRRNTTVLLTTTDLELVKFKFQLATQCNQNHSITVREDSVTGLGKELASHNGRGNYTNNL
jgi:hypothetical protein